MIKLSVIINNKYDKNNIKQFNKCHMITDD